MPAPVNNELFLEELKNLYIASKDSSVWITMKRVQKKGDVTSRCLIRATNGKRKVVTMVRHQDLVRFQIKLAECNKGAITGLRKHAPAASGARRPALH